ncbi:MAG: hypothetical protein ABI565_08785 [Vicinamibacteria bacterium]
MSVIRVAVIESNGQYLVRPSVIFLSREPHDTLRVLNRTNQTVVVSAIGSWPFEATAPVGIEAGDKETLSMITSPSPGSYRFRIEVGANRIVALGNSDPVIIVDDP